MGKKRKPTDKEMQKMRTLYLKGVKPRHIVEKFPDLDITAKDLSSWFSRTKTVGKKKKIKERVEKKLIEDIATQQENANKELISVSQKIVEVVKNYLESGQYKDFTTFSYGSFVKKSSDTMNAASFNLIVRALADAQKIQRTALGMDKEIEEKLPPPVINIDFGDD